MSIGILLLALWLFLSGLIGLGTLTINNHFMAWLAIVAAVFLVIDVVVPAIKPALVRLRKAPANDPQQ